MILTTSRKKKENDEKIVPRRRDEKSFGFNPSYWVPIAQFVERHAHLLAVAAVVLMGVGSAGVTMLRGSMQMEDFFEPDSNVARDHAWLEEHLGPLMPLEVVVRIGPGSELSPSDRLLLVRRIQVALGHMKTDAGTVSLANYLPKVNTLRQHAFDGAARRSQPAVRKGARADRPRGDALHDARRRR